MDFSERGLTCLEILIVLGIIVILFFIIAPGRIRARTSADMGRCRHNLEILAEAAERFRMDHREPPQSLSSLTPDYLTEMPKCIAARSGALERFGIKKSAGKDTYSETYHLVSAEPTITCFGHPTKTKTGCRERIEQLRVAVSEFTQVKGTIPQSLQSVVTEEKLLMCPEGSRYHYKVPVLSYSFFCAGERHKGSDVYGEYPRFDSRTGLQERQPPDE